MRTVHQKSGFTLIEMAIVLVIIGIILTVTLPLLTEGIQRDKLVKGRQTASSLRDEIIGWTSTHAGVLPSLGTVATFASAEDPWGNLIGYWSDPDITQGSAKDICSVSAAPGNLSVHDVGTGSTYAGIAFVIASRGPNRNLQVGYTPGTPVVIDTYPSGYDGASFTDIFHNELGASYDLAAVGEDRFDDVVQYVTYDYLRARICTPEFGDQRAQAAVTFDDMANNFDTSIPTTAGTHSDASFATQNGAVAIDAANGEVKLGNDNAAAVGCLWWNGQNASLCVQPNANGETTDPLNPTTYLGTDGLCYNATAAGVGVWKKARFVFKFTVTSSDENVASTEERGGFVFTLLGVGAGVNDGGVGGGLEAPCGRGADNEMYLGYTGQFPDNGVTASTVPPTAPPKYGVEVDYLSNGQGDPVNVDMSAAHDPTSGASLVGILDNSERPNHISVVFWGATANANDDNTHGSGTLGSATQPLNPDWDPVGGGLTYDEYTVGAVARQDGFISNATHKPSTTGTVRTNWLEEGKDHWVRIVYERGNADFPNKMLVHVWVADSPSAAFKNVGADLMAQDPHGQAGYDLYENSTQAPDSVGVVNADKFRFGWTTATGNVAQTSTTILSDFAFNLGN